MPILSMFYGIVIRMYFFDDRQHHVAHLHAEYAGRRAVFGIDEGEVLAGSVEWPGGPDLSYDTLYLESQPVVAAELAHLTPA